MNTTYVDTTTFRLLIHDFEQFISQLAHQLVTYIHYLSSQLENDWIGVARTRYLQNLQDWWVAVNNLLHQSEDACQYLIETAKKFEWAGADAF